MQDIIINMVNTSDSVPIVRCWNPPTLRDRDLALLDMECEAVQSPNTDRGVITIDNTGLLAVLCSTLIVILALLIALTIRSRNVVRSCVKSTKLEPDYIPRSSSKFLQYQPCQEPRYVSQYQGVQTLKPVITVNPYQNHQTLLRHDQYFLTLAGQETKRQQAEFQRQLSINEVYIDESCVDDEGIYIRVEDPISQI